MVQVRCRDTLNNKFAITAFILLIFYENLFKIVILFPKTKLCVHTLHTYKCF